MRSSISGSKSPALVYAKALVGICAVLIVALEISSAYLLKHHSVTYARVSRQYDEAVKVRPSRPGEPASVLIVGNSLLLEGVDVNRLRELTSTRVRIYPIFLEATGYYDWVYGLRRLFRQGARPQVVVVGTGVNYFVENAVRQDYAPLMLFDARDTLRVASELELDRTATTNLLLAHWSAFWDTRGVIRTQILSHIVPNVKNLFLLASPRPALPVGPESEAIETSRVQSLRELCGAYGVELIILVPPTLSSESAVRQMAIASRKVGVDISVPLDPAALSARFYQPDRLHLNSEGAAMFTSALATDLAQRVAARETVASRN